MRAEPAQVVQLFEIGNAVGIAIGIERRNDVGEPPIVRVRFQDRANGDAGKLAPGLKVGGNDGDVERDRGTHYRSTVDATGVFEGVTTSISEPRR